MPQEQNPTAPWSHDMHQSSRGADMGDEDFSKFLDLDNSFEQFQELDANTGHSTLETPMGRLAFGSNAMQDMVHQNQDMINNMDMSQFQYHQVYQQMSQPHHYQVPPTPVSAEMHASKYIAHHDNTGQMFYDQHQASFTPLVSPAQTPLDNVFCMPELSDYMVADEFFSPLTSPAIEAQASYTSASNTASPIDLNPDHAVNHMTGPILKQRSRKSNFSQQRALRSVKQSPAMKPQQRKRQFSISAIPRDRLETMLEGQGLTERLQADGKPSSALISSEDSVSPEPLSEALMRPPPVPSNLGRSISALHPQNVEQSLPATPAMIMRMPTKQTDATEQLSDLAPEMEDITLPDAAAIMPATDLPHITTDGPVTDDQATPTLSAKPPKINGDGTPRTIAIKKQNTSNESLDKPKKLEPRIGGRGSKKRQSVSTSTISPALRPKISPSISPLAPAPGPGMAALSPETTALFLASKSNYQNILDGTHLPGVSYPQTLADNLSSKRTSHKLAEQGRRNRINLALKEIETLIPPSITTGVKKEKTMPGFKDNEEDSPDKSGAANQGASKASTVEMAIIYIKNLQAELEETKKKLEAAEKTIAQGNVSDSQSSESGA